MSTSEWNNLPGQAGTSGTSGSSGTTGTSGTSGSTGTHGTSGTTGTSGTSGSSGSSGSDGTFFGSSGTSGTSGADNTTNVTAAAVLTDNALVRGDGGTRGVQTSTVLVSDAGEMTNPSQPAFLVEPTETQASIAVGSYVTVVWGTEIFDQGDDFAENVFTAPVVGRYSLNLSIELLQVDSASTIFQMELVTSNKTYYIFIAPNTELTADSSYIQRSMSVLADMDAADTAHVKVYQSGGAQQTGITTRSKFSGFLAC